MTGGREKWLLDKDVEVDMEQSKGHEDMHQNECCGV